MTTSTMGNFRGTQARLLRKAGRWYLAAFLLPWVGLPATAAVIWVLAGSFRPVAARRWVRGAAAALACGIVVEVLRRTGVVDLSSVPLFVVAGTAYPWGMAAWTGGHGPRLGRAYASVAVLVPLGTALVVAGPTGGVALDGGFDVAGCAVLLAAQWRLAAAHIATRTALEEFARALGD